MKIKGHIFAILSIIIWSSTFIVSKVLLGQLTPLQILFGRFIISVICLSIIYPKFTRPENFKEELFFLIIGCTLAMYFYFENSALKYTYSSNVSLIDSTIPIITGIVSAIYYKSRFFNKQNTIGLLVAYAGVFLIILSGSYNAGVKPLGDFLALIGAILFSIYSILLQEVQKNYHIVELTRKVFTYGACLLGVLLILSGEQFTLEMLNKDVVPSMLFLGVLASSVAFLMWNKAIDLIGIIKTNQYIYMTPIFATILSTFIMKEKITSLKILGAIFILTGLYISEKSTVKDVLHEEELDMNEEFEMKSEE